MNFMQLLQSLDELLYEVMSWLVFFPITLWRTVTAPLSMMEYADTELHDRPSQQYEATLSPPLFLLLSLLLSHLLELAFGDATNPIIAKSTGLAGFVDSDGKLLLLRMALFSVIPLIVAAALLVGQKRMITRDRLKPPFYAQCYPAGAFALAIGIGTLMVADADGRTGQFGAAIIVASIAVYLAVQIAWFRRHLRSGYAKAIVFAGVSLIAGLAMGVVMAFLFS